MQPRVDPVRRRVATAAIGFAALAACGAEPGAPVTTLSAGQLSGSVHTVLEWTEPVRGIDSARFGIDAGVLEGCVGCLGVVGRGRKGSKVGDAPIVRGILRSLGGRPVQMPGFAIEPVGESARVQVQRPAQIPPGLTLDATPLAEKKWFGRTLAGLGEPHRGLLLLSDLRQLRRELPMLLGERAGFVATIPGLASFLHVGLRYASQTEAAPQPVDAFVRLARTPVGIAKALDAPPAPLELPSLFLSSAQPPASWFAQRIDAQVLVDALQVVLAGTGFGVFGPQRGDFVQAIGGGVLFRRDLWRAMGSEWACALVDARHPCLLVGVRDPTALRRIVRELAADTSGLLRVSLDERRKASWLELDVMRLALRAVIGRGFLAIGPPQIASFLEALVEAEQKNGLRAVAPGQVFPRAHTESVLGIGRLAGAAIAELRGFKGVAWSVARARDGFAIRAQLER